MSAENSAKYGKTTGKMSKTMTIVKSSEMEEGRTVDSLAVDNGIGPMVGDSK